jgi:adenylate cyclase class IV
MVSNGHWRRNAVKVLRLLFRRFVRTASDKGHLEVERKFALTADEAERLRQSLVDAGYRYAGLASMTDTFLPVLEQGEMMRVRQESIDDNPVSTVLTFKQWVPANTGKERRETERQVRSTTGLVWAILGRFISGKPLPRFSKQRQLFEGTINSAPAVVSIDKVDGLGQFSGWYMEVEIIVPLDGDPSQFTQHIFQLVEELLGAPREDVKRSYQEMLRLASS